MNMPTTTIRSCRRSAVRHTAALWIALGWSILACSCRVFHRPSTADDVLAISDAAHNGNLPVVRSMLQSHPDLISCRTGIGATPLHTAAVMRNVDLVKLLLARGADINARTDEGETPLHFAAAGGNKEVVALLMAHHADIAAKTKHGYTPSQYAVAYRQMSMEVFLRKYGGRDESKTIITMSGIPKH